METLVQNYARGYERLSAALEGVSEELLNFKPGENKWSIKEVVIHVCDAEMLAVDRMKRIISENHPLFFKFDPDGWASRLNYSALDMNFYLNLFKMIRESMVPILQQLKEDDWKRTGVHNIAGKLSLRDVVETFVEHVNTHVRQIERNKRTFHERTEGKR
ncbi:MULTISPECIES: DinB family protein [unclassified Paenibacillus]|uniref:DinB family protein n=1 Tax=unclassified Paenibacillus TaxID=185978 RepID=UPI000AC1EBE1|nr:MULTISPECIES: DinB family protein [unclassified Paenibacillus]